MIRNKICDIGIIYNVLLLVYFLFFIGVFLIMGHVPKLMGLGLIGGVCGNGVIAILAISLAFQGDIASYIKTHRHNKAYTKPCPLCACLVKRHVPSMNPCIPIISPDVNVISIHDSTNSTKKQQTCTNIFLHTFTLFPKICIRAYHLGRVKSTKNERNQNGKGCSKNNHRNFKGFLHGLSHILTLLSKSCIGAYHLLKRLSTKNERNRRLQKQRLKILAIAHYLNLYRVGHKLAHMWRKYSLYSFG
jgi:hypothetical protein